LYIPALKNGDDLKKALRSANKGGSAGYSLFDYNEVNDE